MWPISICILRIYNWSQNFGTKGLFVVIAVLDCITCCEESFTSTNTSWCIQRDVQDSNLPFLYHSYWIIKLSKKKKVIHLGSRWSSWVCLSIKHVSISEFVYLDKWGLFKLKVKKKIVSIEFYLRKRLKILLLIQLSMVMSVKYNTSFIQTS